MRVDLAAQVGIADYQTTLYILCTLQVLSESVGKALKLTGGMEVQETATFVMMFDKFFDIFNVSNFSNSIHQRKPFKAPFHKGSDFRLTVCCHA